MTDWNIECDLRIEYINWAVDSDRLPCMHAIRFEHNWFPMNPEAIMRYFKETGVFFVGGRDDAEAVLPSYEEWYKEQGYGTSQISATGTYVELAETPLIKYLKRQW